MEGINEGGSITRRPLLGETNYPYWKAKMTAFLRSVNMKTWKAVLNGFTSPTQNNAEGVAVVKREVEWTATEAELSLENNKALNAILCAVDDEIIKLISSCMAPKEA
ncbi:hypothetical protein LIER_43117 [Lithospermum erythrorhizon]|uniref:Gag-pol polyprotein n=1 Tax=Lithospermum erythrorhizon TaxID=34254 RepID=A0AAV3PKG2_LITER